jgi:hypothetical protein
VPWKVSGEELNIWPLMVSSSLNELVKEVGMQSSMSRPAFAVSPIIPE